MKKKRFWTLSPAVILLCAALLLAVGSLFFYNRILFYSELAVAAVLLLYTIWHLRHMQKDIRRAMARVAGSLNQSDRDVLALGRSSGITIISATRFWTATRYSESPSVW